MTQKSFTGRARRRTTSKAVRYADRVARTVITAGGIGTILAVSLVCFFLVYVVIPLFQGNRITDWRMVQVEAAALSEPPLEMAADEYGLMAWALLPSGQVVVLSLKDGSELERRQLFEPGQMRAVSFGAAGGFGASGGDLAVALADGSVQFGSLSFSPRFVPREEIPAELRQLAEGEVVRFEDGLLERTPEGQFRLQRLISRFEDPIPLDDPSPGKLIDFSLRPEGPVIVMITEDGRVRYKRVSTRRNIMTGEVRRTLRGSDFTPDPHPEGLLPSELLLSGVADTLFLVWPDGSMRRYDTRDPDEIMRAESLDLLEGERASISVMRSQIGKSTILIGDTAGHLAAWFRTRPEGVETVDGVTLVRAHELPMATQAPVTAIATSVRDRRIAAGFEDGKVGLYHVTSRQLLDVGQVPDGAPIQALALTPKDDKLVAVAGGNLHMWRVDAPHPESTIQTMFGRVWYEGYAEPRHVWQSSSGTDDFEPKYGLVPLVFGTIKATFYSMLIGVPLALLAAIYTSEFMHRRRKAKIKPTIEMMASLPSVVLGFVAALVIAPFVEDIVPQILCLFFTIPFTVLLGAYLWQLLPERTAARYGDWRLAAVLLMLPLGVYSAILMGPLFERVFFWIETEEGPVGDIRGWLAGRPGASATGGWMLAMLPLSAIAVGILSSRLVTPWLRTASENWSRTQLAVIDLGKFLVCAVATLVVAYLLSALVAQVLFDPRESFLGTYSQRNALVVGFVMGFAVIPIIYTISEDALSAVPEQLRAASLGAGATPWQTAARIVIPTAMSGIFSAVMIGFGRAVGETMIVLMAAGNTPVLDWNIFNGFRTLSANIAVELPEAAIHSTHYRMLFLAALTLFAMTFVLNTVAEAVRLRFRKRAYQL